MSYDVTLTTRSVDGVEIEVFDRNMTSNVAPVWREAGCDLAEFHGADGRDLAPSARAAAQLIAKDRGRFAPLVRGGGEWGTVESAMDFLTSIADACELHPSARIHVYR